MLTLLMLVLALVNEVLRESEPSQCRGLTSLPPGKVSPPASSYTGSVRVRRLKTLIDHVSMFIILFSWDWDKVYLGCETLLSTSKSFNKEINGAVINYSSPEVIRLLSVCQASAMPAVWLVLCLSLLCVCECVHFSAHVSICCLRFLSVCLSICLCLFVSHCLSLSVSHCLSLSVSHCLWCVHTIWFCRNCKFWCRQFYSNKLDFLGTNWITNEKNGQNQMSRKCLVLLFSGRVPYHVLYRLVTGQACYCCSFCRRK